MCPSSSVHDKRNCWASYAVVISNDSMKLASVSSCPDFFNIFFCELGKMMFFSVVHGFVLGFVKMVFANRVPPKIRKPVVKWVSVVVTSMVAIWARANKCDKHKTMDALERMPICVMQFHSVVNLIFSKFEDARIFSRPVNRAFSGVRANTTKITNFVATVTGNSFPFFIHNNVPLCSDIGIIQQVR